MHPRSDQNQHCLTFQLSVNPRCRAFSYRDHLGNHVHHFDIPGKHGQLVIVAESLVDVDEPPVIPAFLAPGAWQELDALLQQGDYSEMLVESPFTQRTPALEALASQWNIVRRDDPLMLLHELNQRIYSYFDYVPRYTTADSPIDVALESRMGVCQDFAHIMLALVRGLGIPCRYVSGYLHHNIGDHDRSEASATHAWVEAMLPHLGWVGFDPTNHLFASGRHIRTAIGRDYADVPPTRGIFRGAANTDLTVAVQVKPYLQQPEMDQPLPVPEDWSVLVEKAQQVPPPPPPPPSAWLLAQQQQQQQQ